MIKEHYEAPAVIELGDFAEETGFIGRLFTELIPQIAFSW